MATGMRKKDSGSKGIFSVFKRGKKKKASSEETEPLPNPTDKVSGAAGGVGLSGSHQAADSIQHHDEHISLSEQNGNPKQLSQARPLNKTEGPINQQEDEGLAPTAETPKNGTAPVHRQRDSPTNHAGQTQVERHSASRSPENGTQQPPTQVQNNSSSSAVAVPDGSSENGAHQAAPTESGPESLTGTPTQVENNSSSSAVAVPDGSSENGAHQAAPTESGPESLTGPPTQVQNNSSSSAVAVPDGSSENGAHQTAPTDSDPASLTGPPTQVEQDSDETRRATLSQKFVNQEITQDENLVDSLRLCLDKSHRVIKNHEHLACTLGVPPDIRAKCKLNTEYSPTEKLLDLLGAYCADLTVADFILALKGIGRKDVVLIIEETIPDAESSSGKVCDVISNDVKLVDAIATKLDENAQRVINNWFHLGLKLDKLSKEQLDDLKSGTNPTLALMEFIYYSHKPNTSVGEFIQMMTDFKRNDVLGTLRTLGEDISDQKMTQAVPLDSDCMAKICRSLNKSVTGLKGWKFVANALKVPREIYEDFNPKNLQSPTKMLLKWLSTNRPDLTVDQLCVALGEIGHNDVVLLLQEKLS